MQRKLKILQLVNVRWFNACAWYALNLSLGLRERGHRVIFAGGKGNPVLGKAREFGLPVVNLISDKLNPHRVASNLLHLSSLMKEESIDLINAHRGEDHLYGSLMRARYRGIPLVRTRGDVRPPKNNPFNLLLHRHLTDMVIITCSSLKSPLRKLGLREEVIEVVLPGVDTNYYQPLTRPTKAKRSLGIDGSTPLVGMVGRLSPVKGHRFFIEAASHVVQTVAEAKFLIVGQDAQSSSSDLEKVAASKEILDRFIFLPYQEDIRDTISALDLGVIASTGSETICRVALEFMAMGKPVVGTAVNSIPELIVDGLNGIIVPTEQPMALAEAIVELLKNRDKREEFSLEARRRAAEDFSIRKMAETTERLYYDLL